MQLANYKPRLELAFLAQAITRVRLAWNELDSNKLELIRFFNSSNPQFYYNTSVTMIGRADSGILKTLARADSVRAAHTSRRGVSLSHLVFDENTYMFIKLICEHYSGYHCSICFYLHLD